MCKKARGMSRACSCGGVQAVRYHAVELHLPGPSGRRLELLQDRPVRMLQDACEGDERGPSKPPALKEQEATGEETRLTRNVESLKNLAFSEHATRTAAMKHERGDGQVEAKRRNRRKIQKRLRTPD